MNNPLLLHFVTVTIFSLMLAIGLNHSAQHLTSLWRQPGLLLRSLLAVIVFVPAVVGLLLWFLDLPLAVATGLAVLAAAPGAPLTTKRSQMAKGDITYSASLQLTLALLAVVITPLTLSIFYALFDLATERVTPFEVARQVGEVTFLPVIVGLLLQRFVPRLANFIAKPVRVLANVLFLLLFIVLITLLAITPELRQMLRLGALSIATIIVIGGLSLSIGHLLGGPSRARRSSLAIACIARNAGLAMFIATLSEYGGYVIPTLLAYLILGALVAVPYSILSKRRMTEKEIT